MDKKQTTQATVELRQLGFLQFTRPSQNLNHAILATLIPDFEYLVNQDEIIEFFSGEISRHEHKQALSLEQIFQKEGQNILTELFSKFRILSNFTPSNFNLVTPDLTNQLIAVLPILFVISNSSEWFGLEYLDSSGLKYPVWDYSNPHTIKLIKMIKLKKPDFSQIFGELDRQSQILEKISKPFTTEQLNLVLTNLNDLIRLNNSSNLTKVIAYRKELVEQLHNIYDNYLTSGYDESVFEDYVLLSKLHRQSIEN